MDYTSDIFARLQKGESMESIANDLTKSLNNASQHYSQIKAAEQAKKEAEAKKAAAVQENKVKAVYELRDALVNVFKVWGVASDVIAEFAEYDDEDLNGIIEVFDELLPAVEKYAAVHSAIQDMFKDEEQNVKPKKDPIEDFLNAFVR
jgi:tRNA(Ile2) C34 agmatinyltransferase TiaS